MAPDSRQPSDLFSGLPFGEAELLAYVEDDASFARRSEVEAFLKTRPEMRRVLDAMRQDRVVFDCVGEAAAPEGIVERALAVVEREALLGAGGLIEPAPIPIESARPRRALRALALAAGFLMLAGGTSYWLTLLVKPAGPASPSGTGGDSARLAMDTKAKTDASSPAAPAKTLEADQNADTRVATAEADTTVFAQSPLPPIEPDATEPDESDDDALALSEPSESDGPMPSGIGSSARYPVATISPDRALELAREGRLAIYLTGRSRGRADARLDGGQGLPSSGAMVIDIPATTGAIAELCSSLSETSDGEVTLEELEEAYEGSADSQIARYWDRIVVPVMVED